MLSKALRLRLFLARLAIAPSVGSHDEALKLIATLLDAVEDKHSGIAANPRNWRTDGRMYPPQPDSARPSVDLPGVIVYRSVAHRILIAANGAFAIIEVGADTVLIEKAGRDGRVMAPGGSRALKK